jgi:gas vesicle protein
MNSGKVLLGLLVGVAAGAIMGVLFAPEKGEKTRRDIVSKGEDYVDALQGKFDGFVENITSKIDRSREEAEEFIVKGRARFEDIKKDGKSTLV